MKTELIEVVKKLKLELWLRDEYIENLPSDISTAFFDNTYSNSQSKSIDTLIESLFGEYTEDVCWFLYEFEAGKSPGPHMIDTDGKQLTFKTNEDYYRYLETL